MFVYSLTYAINAFGEFFDKRSRKIITMFVLIALALISGLRYYMGGTDVYVYSGAYNSAPPIKDVISSIFQGVQINSGFENGFILICSITRLFNLNYFGFSLVYSCLFYFLMYKGLNRYIGNWSIFIALFMYKIFFYNTFISIRQGLTLAIFCYGIHFIEEKKPIKYFITCLVALLCHNASFVLFFVYLINYIPLSKKIIRNMMLIFAPTWFLRGIVDLSPIIMRIGEFLGSGKGEQWAESTEEISIIHTLECYIVFIAILLFFEYIENDEKTKMFVKMMLVLLPIFTLCSEWIVLTRIKDYFVLFYGLVLGNISVQLKRKNPNANVIHFVYLLAFIGMIRYVLVFDGGVLMKYVTFLSKGESIFY